MFHSLKNLVFLQKKMAFLKKFKKKWYFCKNCAKPEISFSPTRTRANPTRKTRQTRNPNPMHPKSLRTGSVSKFQIRNPKKPEPDAPKPETPDPCSPLVTGQISSSANTYYVLFDSGASHSFVLHIVSRKEIRALPIVVEGREFYST